MSRTLKYKLLYVAVVVTALTVLALVFVTFEPGLVGVLIAAVLLLAPGRIGAYFLRELFLSRRLIAVDRFEDAIASAERFLDQLDRQPWRQHFIYCFFGIYTWNTRAMALNNLGAAKMELGRIDEAEGPLGEALSLDADFPMPYYNLGIIEAVREDHARSDQLFAKARLLGFRPSAVDKVITRVGAAFARVQSFPG